MTEIQRCAKCGHQKELHTEGECVACPKSSVDAHLHEFVSDSRVQQLEQRIERLRKALTEAEGFVDRHSAQLAEATKPVTDEEWNFDNRLLPTPELRTMFERVRSTFNAILASRQSSSTEVL